MIKKFTCLSMIVFAFAITSNGYAGGPTPVPMPLESPTVSTVQPSASFTKIDSVGNFNIIIKPVTLYTQNAFMINAPMTDSPEVYAVVNKGTLFLRQSPQHPDLVNITVYMNQLTGLNVVGSTNVFGKRIRGSQLIINANTTGAITLTGSISLREVNIAGATQLYMSWVYGNIVNIFAHDQADMNISGHVKMARIQLDGHSFLKARYLRASHTWIKTQGYAQAQIISSASVESYPADYSNVYYYKTPTVLNRVNSNSGNTLQLGWSY